MKRCVKRYRIKYYDLECDGVEFAPSRRKCDYCGRPVWANNYEKRCQCAKYVGRERHVPRNPRETAML